MTKKILPKSIEEVGFDFDWSNEKVWALDITPEKMSMRNLEWHFDLPFWNTENGFYNLTPYEVLNNPDVYVEEFERIQNANLDYPLDIMFWKNKWLLLDGLHRLAKAKVQGMRSVKVRKIPQSAITTIKK